MLKKLLFQKPVTPEEAVKILKGIVIVQAVAHNVLMLVMQEQLKSQAKSYRELYQMYEILAEHANWEDPMIRHKMETLKQFRDITKGDDPGK